MDFFIVRWMAKLLRMKMTMNLPEKRYGPNSIIYRKSGMRGTLWHRLLGCRANGTESLSDGRMQGKVKDSMDEELEEITDKLSDIPSKAVDKNDESMQNKEKWHFAASVVDRLFFLMAGVAFFLSVIIFYLKIPHYNNERNFQDI